MTNTQQNSIERFVQDAELGGWDGTKTASDHYSIFLDKDAWIAVGKVRWDKPVTSEDKQRGTTLRRMYLAKWHTFIDALADGKTIEEALNEIEK